MKKRILLLTLVTSFLLTGCSLGNHIHEWEKFVAFDDESHYKICKEDKAHIEKEEHHFELVGQYLDYANKLEYKCHECGFLKVENIDNEYCYEVVDPKYIYKSISSATAYYYKTNKYGDIGTKGDIFLYTKLPAEYKEVEYIESKGGNILDTGISIQSGDKMVIAYYGAGDYFYGQHCVNEKGDTVFYSKYIAIKNSLFAGVDIKESLSSAGQTIEFLNAKNLTNGTLHLFGMQTEHSVLTGAGWISKFQYYRNNKLIADYIPCYRIEDRKPGFYDLANGNFHYITPRYKFWGGAIVSDELIDGKYYQTEYTESFGKQYINADVKFKKNTRIATEIAFESGNVNMMFGHWGSIAMGLNHVNNPLCTLGSKANPSLSYYYVSRHDKHFIDMASGGDIKIDDDVFEMKSEIPELNKDIYLFADSNEKAEPCKGDGTNYGCGKIYSFKIYEGDVLVRDFIPVVDAENEEYGLYDKIENKFYGNDNKYEVFEEGDVVLSKKLPAGYTELSYIESDGTQYIDTGYKFNLATDSFDIGVQSTSGTQNGVIFGNYLAGHNGFFLRQSYLNDFVSLDYSNNLNKSIETQIKADNTEYHNYIYDGRTLYADRVANKTSIFTDYFETHWTTSLLGCPDVDSSGKTNFKGRLYFAMLYRDGKLVRNFVPCRNPEGIQGLYDLIDNEFFTDSQAGYHPVIAGDDLEFKQEIKTLVEPTYNSPGKIEYFDYLTKEYLVEDIDPLAYKVTFVNGNSEVYVYEKGPFDEPVVTDVSYSINKYTFNYSREGAVVYFKPIVEEGYTLRGVRLMDGDATLTKSDDLYTVKGIKSDIKIQVFTEPK